MSVLRAMGLRLARACGWDRSSEPSGSGFLPTLCQGVKLRGGKAPVVYPVSLASCSAQVSRQMLDDLSPLILLRYPAVGDPQILPRVPWYEL